MLSAVRVASHRCGGDDAARSLALSMSLEVLESIRVTLLLLLLLLLNFAHTATQCSIRWQQYKNLKHLRCHFQHRCSGRDTLETVVLPIISLRESFI